MNGSSAVSYTEMIKSRSFRSNRPHRETIGPPGNYVQKPSCRRLLNTQM